MANPVLMFIIKRYLNPIGEKMYMFWKPCEDYWWSTLLYINNFHPNDFNKECMNWTWYLANDTQFYILAPGIIAIFIAVSNCCCSFCYKLIVHLKQDWGHGFLVKVVSDDLMGPPWMLLSLWGEEYDLQVGQWLNKSGRWIFFEKSVGGIKLFY